MQTSPTQWTRRDFVKQVAAGAMVATALPAVAQPAPRKIKLGFDNFSIRAFGWKAEALLDYAAAQKLDIAFFSDLDVYESFETPYLQKLKAKADAQRVGIYVGTYSICPTSKSVTTKFGLPEEHLALAIRVAKTLGSPVVRCVLGNREDRKVDGGIARQIERTVQVLRGVRSLAIDAGIKIAVENHAGDMQAAELVTLIETAGKEFVGATLDSGNATWALEDPLVNLEILGPYAVATGMRDSVIWDTPEGAAVQWTAMGEGPSDWPAYLKRYRALCPDTPFLLEIISGFALPFPYLKDDFWQAYPNLKAAEFARFLRMARAGKPLPPFKPAEGQNRKEAEQAYQKAELEKSIRCCRETLGLGG